MKKFFCIVLITALGLLISAFFIFLASLVLKSAFDLPVLTIKQCVALAFVVGVIKNLFVTKRRKE